MMEVSRLKLGGFPPYEFLWTNNNDTLFDQDFNPTNSINVIQNLSPGTYSVQITDSNECQEIFENFIITEPDLLSLSYNFIPTICYNDSTGQINLDVLGGTSPYYFLWSDSSINQNLTNVPAGIYSIQVTDSNGCQDTILDIEIQNYDEIIVDLESSSFTNLDCFGDNNGFANLTISGGVPPYSNDIELINLTAGEYNTIITDSVGCQIPFSFTISQPDITQIDYFVSDVICFGENNGSVDIQISGGSPPYFINDSSFIDTFTIDNLEPGFYSSTITDSQECESSISYQINEPDEISIIIDEVNESTCFSYLINNGSIDISVTGGSGNFEYNWISSGAEFGSSEQDIDSLSAGTYYLTVTDGDCIINYSDSIQIFEPTPIEFDTNENDTIDDGEDLDGNGIINSSFDYTEYICSNDPQSGSVVFNLGGGVPPYEFNLVDEFGSLIVSENGIFNGLSEGCYDVTIYDFNSNSNSPSDCVTNVNFCIEETSPSISVEEFTPSGCGVDGNSIFNLSGLSPYNVYAYVDDILINQQLGIDDSVINFNNLPSGFVEVFLEDSIGCISTTSFNLQNVQNDIEIIDLGISNPLCPNGTGSLDIQFSNSININSSGNFGTASISIDSNADCIFNETLSNVYDIVNNGENDLSISIDDLETGNYVIAITDNFGCETTSCFTIESNSEFDPLNFFASVDAICYGASGSAYVSNDPNDVGGEPFETSPYYIVEWYNSNGSPVQNVAENALIASSLPYGSYYVIITDANECEYIHEFSINQPEIELDPGVSSQTDDFGYNISCFGSNDGEIYVQPIGGQNDYYSLTVTFPNGNIINDVIVPGLDDTYYINGLSPGEYTISIDDGICEPVFQTIEITQPQLIEWNVETEPLLCFNDVVEWSNGNLSFDNGNSYTYTGGTGSPNLYWFDSPQNCSSLDLSSSLDINNLGSGTYYLYSVDGNNCCTDQGQHIIPITPLFESDFNPFDSELWIYCPGDNTGIIAINSYGGTPPSGPYTYIWEYNGEYIQDYDNMNIVEDLSSGQYTITVNDSNSCNEIVHEIFIDEPLPLDVSFNVSSFNGFNVSCNGDSDGEISVDIENGLNPNDNYGYNVQWYDSNNNFISDEEDLTGLAAGTYYLEVNVDIPENENFIESCSVSETLQITEPNPIIANIDFSNDVSCFSANDGEIGISVSGGTGSFSFIWSNGQQSQNIQDLGPGNYSVTITDSNGCSRSINDIVIYEPDEFSSDIPSDFEQNSTTPALCSFGNVNSGSISFDLDLLYSFLDGGNLPYGIPLLSNNGVNQTGIVDGNNITFSNLDGGNYTLTVLDDENCSLSFNIFVKNNNEDLISFTPNIIPPSCGSLGGSIFITEIQNGYPPYSISIVSDDDSNVSYNFSTTDDFNSFDIFSND